MLKENLGFIGAGSMAEAILNGILSRKMVSPEQIYMINRKNNERLDFFHKNYGINTTRDYFEVVSNCKILVIAVKPQDIESLLFTLKDLTTPEHIIITVAAGISTTFVEQQLGKNVQVVRVMPNTSCQVKESATAIVEGRYVKPSSMDTVFKIFSSVGKVAQVNEDMLDAVTGLSGSGPAYVYLLMEAMIEAGIKAGLSEDLSKDLAIQTVFGAAKMVLETGESPKRLRRKVTSPGGTTMAGVKTLEAMGFSTSIIKAVNSAAKRSHEMMLENTAK